MPSHTPVSPHTSQAKAQASVLKHGACNLCEAICGLVFDVQSNAQGERIISIKGDADDPLSRGHICPKAIALKDLHEDPDRLRQPVKRITNAKGETRWQTIGWDEAFDLTVQGLARVREQHGSNAVAVYQGNPTVHNWGNITHGHLFLSQLKTKQRYSATSVDQLPHHLVGLWLYGHQFHIPIPDIDHTQFMLIIGGNPLASNGSLMTVPDVRHRLKALQARGGKLVVVDPRRTETAAVANEHLFIDPGSDAAWLLAIIHTLLADNLAHPDQWADLLDGMAALRSAVAAFTPEATQAFTGIDAGTTRRLAREFAQAPSAVCYGRMGVSTQVHGVICQWAIQVINLLTGNVDRVGGALLTHPAMDLIKLGLAGKGHHNLWQSRVRGLPESGGELPVATLAEEMLTPGPGQVRALVTTCGNPVLSTPNGQQMDRALSGLDFMVCIDFYLNETTRHADVILPPTCMVEHDHYDLIFLTFAVRNTAKYVPPIVAPASNAKHDWQIYAELAKRYAQQVWAMERASVTQRLKAMLTRSILGSLSPKRVLQIGLSRSPGNLRLKHLLAAPSGVDLGPLKPGLINTLQAKKRRVWLLPAPIAQGLPDVLASVQTANSLVASTSSSDTLKLIGRRDVRSNNSWMHNSERLVSGKARCVLWMHPQDAQARGLSDGQSVDISSRVGRINVPLHLTDDIRPGVVSLPHGWGHGRSGVQMRVAQAHAGASINDLSDELLVDRISGNAAFSAQPVQITATASNPPEVPRPHPLP